MPIKFATRAREDYLYWQETDRTVLRRINALIKDIERQPFSGIGKPEPLKHQLTGFWLRRIDDRHRLVYAVEQGVLLIAQCRDHYQQANMKRICLAGHRGMVGSAVVRQLQATDEYVTAHDADNWAFPTRLCDQFAPLLSEKTRRRSTTESSVVERFEG